MNRIQKHLSDHAKPYATGAGMAMFLLLQGKDAPAAPETAGGEGSAGRQRRRHDGRQRPGDPAMVCLARIEVASH